MNPDPASSTPSAGRTNPTAASPSARRKYVRAVGPRLRWVLLTVLGLFALLGANSVYLSAITFLEWVNRPTLYQNWFYQVMLGSTCSSVFSFSCRSWSSAWST